MRENFEFDELEVLTAGARGVPGKRTFFILAGNGERLIRMWVEKNQLVALGEAIEELISGLPERRRPGPTADAPEPPEPAPVASEFRARSFGLGYDRERRRSALMVNEDEDDNDIEAPSVQAWATLAKMQAFSQRITTISAAGRQPCPLCGIPIDPEGHICPRTNGYHPALRF